MIFDGMKWETFSDKMTTGIACASGGAAIGTVFGGVGSVVGGVVGYLFGFWSVK